MSDRVLVIGASGMLGQDVCQRFAPHFALVTASRQKGDILLDITDVQAIRRAVASVKPAVVLLCAAYTDVDGCERHPEQAYRVNAYGAGCVASACADAGARLVYISTDYVFNGAKTGGYTEWDVPRPLNVYGASKLAGEQWVREVCPRHWIVRTAWLYGIGGKSFPRTILNAALQGRPLRVVDDQIGSPTFTRDLADVILNLMQGEAPYGTYHAVNSGSASWYDVACEAVRLAQARGMLSDTVRLTPICSTDWLSPARRPACSVLKMERLRWAGIALPRHWKEALREYLERLNF